MFNYMRDYPEPAMSRQPLSKLVLNVKRLKKDASPKEILGLALTPPKLNEIEVTILKLKETGALSLYKNYEFCKTDGDLTWAGELMADLPVDITLAKLVLFGLVFGKLRETIIIAAALSQKSIFKHVFRSDFEYYKSKFAWSDGNFCDFTSIVNAYNTWEFQQKFAGTRNNQHKNWAHSRQLQISSLKQVIINVYF